ncbi:MAG: hypothetical protein U0235_25365 [Polyangiaceae bacterium]
MEIDNSEEKLRPGRSVTARIHTATAPEALVLPRDRGDDQDASPPCSSPTPDTSVEVRTVVVGARDPTRVEVKDGLSPGERVVTKGVFALKSEVFR